MANVPPPVPTYSQPIADDKGTTSRSWYFYLQYLGQQIKQILAAQSAGFSGTIVTAKLTTANGSMTFVKGVLVSQTPAT